MGAGPRGTSAERLARHRSERWWGHARCGVAQQAGQGAVVVPTPPNISLVNFPIHRIIWGSRYWCIANNNKKAHHAWPKEWMNPAFVDWPATHGRLLFWWSAKQQINGMLFWDVNTFMNQPGRSAVQRIDDTMLTDFNPATSFFDADSQPNAPPLSWESDGTNTNGDGSLTYPGANGPLSSVRLENVRDGIEVRQRSICARFPSR